MTSQLERIWLRFANLSENQPVCDTSFLLLDNREVSSVRDKSGFDFTILF